MRRSLVVVVLALVGLLAVGGIASAEPRPLTDELLRSLGLDEDQIAETRDEVDALLDGLAEAGIIDEREWAADGDRPPVPFEDRFRTAADEWDELRDRYLDDDSLAAWDEVRGEYDGCVETRDDPTGCGSAVSDGFGEVWGSVDDFGHDHLFGEDFDGDFFDDGVGWGAPGEDGFGPSFHEDLDGGFGEGFDPESGFVPEFDPELGDGFVPPPGDGFDPESGFVPEFDPEFGDGFVPPPGDGFDDGFGFVPEFGDQPPPEFDPEFGDGFGDGFDPVLDDGFVPPPGDDLGDVWGPEVHDPAGEPMPEEGP
ncbi:MAG: hypothetical protein AAFZ07_15370 [Actinomycetota bacterium]